MQQLRLEFELGTLIPHSRPIPTTSSAHPQYKMRNTEILTYLKSYKVYSVLWYFENFSFPNIAKFIESNDVYWIYVQLKRIHPQAAFLKVGCAESVKKNVNTSDSLNSALLPLLSKIKWNSFRWSTCNGQAQLQHQRSIQYDRHKLWPFFWKDAYKTSPEVHVDSVFPLNCKSQVNKWS